MAEKFYPDNFQDWSEASFGSMMLDAVAYVGDQLSFYIDYNVNESFLDTAYSTDNIIRHGRVLGYKDQGRPSTYGEVAVYVEVPASSSGLGPDSSYIPILAKGTELSSQNGLKFIVMSNVDFNDPKNPIVVSKTAEDTGAPTHFAIKAYANVVSGKLGTVRVAVGAFQKFKKIKIPVSNVAEIISVQDSNGVMYYEVEHLAQDIVYREIANRNFKNDNVPSLLKPFIVNRKFVLVREGRNVSLQFGSGDAAVTDIIADPQSVAMDLYGKDYISDVTFDPTRLSKNLNYGIVPTNTTLSITYRTTNGSNSNVATGQLNNVNTSYFQFAKSNTLNSSKIRTVKDSLECLNETPIVGDITHTTPGELKNRIMNTFPTQNRAVTIADYQNLTYRMPTKFGSVIRCSVQKDSDSLKRNLNMYVISQDSSGKLVKTNSLIKNNLKTWIDRYRMINDTIDILDPYIINLSIEFVIVPRGAGSRDSAMYEALTNLKAMLSQVRYIGQSFSINSIYTALKAAPSILDVVDVRVRNKTGTQYSNIEYSINENLSPDGNVLICPRNAIFEFKYLDVDLKGRLR
tara:strand:- start:965 stop:2680 length:1716 start_codon:yes stop_codon:yes gene_type:complete